MVIILTGEISLYVAIKKVWSQLPLLLNDKNMKLIIKIELVSYMKCVQNTFFFVDSKLGITLYFN